MGSCSISAARRNGQRGQKARRGRHALWPVEVVKAEHRAHILEECSKRIDLSLIRGGTGRGMMTEEI